MWIVEAASTSSALLLWGNHNDEKQQTPNGKEWRQQQPFLPRRYQVVHKKGTVLLSTSLAWPAVAC